MKNKLIAAIREVPISQTYEEYVEALADRLEIVLDEIRDETLEEVSQHFLKLFPMKDYKENSNGKR